MFIYLNRLFVSLVSLDPFCKSYVETDLTFLHYVTFIKPLTFFPTAFDSEHFTTNSINKVIEAKTNDSFILHEEHFFAAVLLYKKLMRLNSKTCRMEFLSSSQNHKVSDKRFLHNKIYHNKFILLILILQMYILKVTSNKSY
jgi:hypothetical protein